VTPGTGLCRTCGRKRPLAGSGKLPAHWNLACVPCSGDGKAPWSPAGITEAQAWDAGIQQASDGLASAGEILAALPAAGLVASGVSA
jgi:hypothetical protein